MCVSRSSVSTYSSTHSIRTFPSSENHYYYLLMCTLAGFCVQPCEHSTWESRYSPNEFFVVSNQTSNKWCVRRWNIRTDLEHIIVQINHVSPEKKRAETKGKIENNFRNPAAKRYQTPFDLNELSINVKWIIYLDVCSFYRLSHQYEHQNLYLSN